MRHRRTRVKCGRCVQLEVPACAQARRQAREIGVDMRAIPDQRGGIPAGGLANRRLLSLAGRHLHPEHAQRFLVRELIEYAEVRGIVGRVSQARAVLVDNRNEAESVTDLVQHDAQQVRDVAAAVVVPGQLVIETVVEITAAEAAGGAVDGTVEGCGDVVLAALILSGQRIRQCTRIEHAAARGAWKGAEHPHRARRSEHAGVVAASQRIEVRFDDDRHRTRDQLAP